MPRIYTSASDPIDFCKSCFRKHFPNEDAAYAKYGDPSTNGEGPDDRGNCFGYEAEHPCYEEDTRYKCEICRKPLTEVDD